MVRILSLVDSDNEHPSILFGRFYLFFLSELGYALQTSECGICKKEIGKNSGGFNFDTGFVCVNCFESHLGLNFALCEILNYFFCLNNKISVQNISHIVLIKQAKYVFLDRYTKHHIPGFSGIQSLNIFNNFK